MPATEVARRAGHGVAVLLKSYAHCIDGQADAANQRITDTLGPQDNQSDPEPGDEGDEVLAMLIFRSRWYPWVMCRGSTP